MLRKEVKHSHLLLPSNLDCCVQSLKGSVIDAVTSLVNGLWRYIIFHKRKGNVTGIYSCKQALYSMRSTCCQTDININALQCSCFRAQHSLTSTTLFDLEVENCSFWFLSILIVFSTSYTTQWVKSSWIFQGCITSVKETQSGSRYCSSVFLDIEVHLLTLDCTK